MPQDFAHSTLLQSYCGCTMLWFCKIWRATNISVFLDMNCLMGLVVSLADGMDTIT